MQRSAVGQQALRLASGLAVLGLLSGCPKASSAPSPVSVSPPENLFLRSSFDTDPSAYVGRFFPEGDLDLDESRGMALACSTLVSWRYIEGGGVQTSEVFAASSGVQARLGLPLLGAVAGGVQSRRTARVDYTLTGKMVSTVDDPAALAACCKAQPDQCTDRMVGEFLQGTGTVYLEIASGSGLEAQAETPGTGLGGVLSHAQGVAWRRAVVFPQPVYFAFKATPTSYQQQPVRRCSTGRVARSKAQGALVLSASSGPAATERAARRRARVNLQAQVPIATGLAGEAEAKGTVLGLQEVDWCVEAVQLDGAVHHEAHVVGVVTDEEQSRVQKLPWPEPPTVTSVPVDEPCAAWMETQPVSRDGLFVVGRTLLPAFTEQGARLRARNQLRTRAGWITGLGAVALTKGALLGVQEQDWCVHRHQRGKRIRYEAAVLGFVSHAEGDRLRALPDLLPQSPTHSEVGR